MVIKFVDITARKKQSWSESTETFRNVEGQWQIEKLLLQAYSLDIKKKKGYKIDTNDNAHNNNADDGNDNVYQVDDSHMFWPLVINWSVQKQFALPD